MNKLFNPIAIDNIEIKVKIDSLKAAELLNCEVIGDQDIKKIEVEIGKDLENKTRGKFLLEFLKKILKDLESKNKSLVYFTSKRQSVSCNLSSNILSNYTDCADTPETLIKYLSKFTT